MEGGPWIREADRDIATYIRNYQGLYLEGRRPDRGRGRPWRSADPEPHAIRYALEEHDARIAFEKKIVGIIFDTVWGVIPGGGTLTSVGKDLLKTGLKEGLDSAMSEGAPKKQAEAILLKFVKACNDLKASGELDDVRSRLAITTFEAAMR
jgi:hypothetical protein